MNALLTTYLDLFYVFVFVLCRLGGLMMTAPILGAQVVPLRIRGLLAVALALLVTPLFSSLPVDPPVHLVDLVVMLAQELLLGLTLGLGVMILFMGLQVAGQTVAQMSALSLADIFDPTFDSNLSVFSQLLEVVALSCFLLIGGHRLVMAGLLETFQWISPGEISFSQGVVSTLTDILTQSFLLGIRAAAPTIVALLMSIIVLGLISRTLPQLNILAVGFSLNAIVLIGTLSLSLGTIVWMFQHEVGPTVENVLNAFYFSQGDG